MSTNRPKRKPVKPAKQARKKKALRRKPTLVQALVAAHLGPIKARGAGVWPELEPEHE